jgi:thiamine biosynthesis lipoprotein
MTQPDQNFEISVPRAGSIEGTHRFRHEAMATFFEIIVSYDDPEYARQAAYAAFDELDKIEQQLSCFIENSDISQINNLTADQPLVLGPDAFDCLNLSLSIYEQTAGAFDVTVGALYKCWLDGDDNLCQPSQQELNAARTNTGSDHITLDEIEHTVTIDVDSVQIDLGGIGKGFAVDRMADLLSEWSVDTVFIHGGSSSVLALGHPEGRKGWPVTLSHPNDRKNKLLSLDLCNVALGSSGLQKGQHIIDPRIAEPAENILAAWSCAPDAGTADALSTAFMIMTKEQVEQYCAEHPDSMAMIIPQRDGAVAKRKMVLSFGGWDKFSSEG